MKAITDVPNPSYSENVMPASFPDRQKKVTLSVDGSHHSTEAAKRIEVFDSLQNSRLGADSPPLESKKFHHGDGSKVTYRERLGGHLHPRDMRRMVIPFSKSNEPALIVRRHAMLFNFDPLRAIILRDRLLVLVPDGADSILEELEGRLRGGLADVEHDVFGDNDDDPAAEPGQWGAEDIPLIPTHRLDPIKEKSGSSQSLATSKPSSAQSVGVGLSPPQQEADSNTFNDDHEDLDDDPMDSELDMGELHELAGQTWLNLPFELQCVDSVLHSITELLASQASDIQDETVDVIDRLLDPNMGVGEFAQETLRTSKNNVNDMVSRVQWFMRALTQVLNDDADMALMNLTRLITHPERFIQPVPASILEEESDEPELILVSGINLTDGS
jgi:magnesium transporter